MQNYHVNVRHGNIYHFFSFFFFAFFAINLLNNEENEGEKKNTHILL